MRAASPLRVTIERFGVWNGFLGCLGVLLCLNCGLWLALSRDGSSPWQVALVVFAGSACLLCLISSIRRAPVVLRWDSQRWHSGDGVDADRECGPWRLRVSLDLGSFILLRLESDDPAVPLKPRWLPLQRHGLRADWHAVRCALHVRTGAPASTQRPQVADSN
jgi:hypothetical protein